MGIGGISIWQLLIVLAIIVLLFGTKKLGSLGSDLGSAIRGFKDSVKGDESSDDSSTDNSEQQANLQKQDSTDQAQAKQQAPDAANSDSSKKS